MLNEAARKELEKQQYRLIGNHSAVKICGWTKRMIQGRGGCYKLKFYGIMSNKCLQLTTNLSCPNSCVICWRGYKAPVAQKWQWDSNSPELIIDEAIKAHHNLLVGFAGNKDADKKAYVGSLEVKHVALSLTGEPILYDRLDELLGLFNRRGISTFLVTKGQYPEQISKLGPVTQLYLSLDAPTKELLRKLDKPFFNDHWERLNRSLKALSKKEQRTCIRVTLVKGLNMNDEEKWADLIREGNPDFVEVKAYMHVGASRKRLRKEDMPRHYEVVGFSRKLVGILDGYEFVSEHVPSRVVLIAKKGFKVKNMWHTWIDFNKWTDLVNGGKRFSGLDYSRKTPERALVDEDTQELEFWE